MMGVKAITAVIVGIAMLGLQACFFPSGGAFKPVGISIQPARV